MFTAVISYKMMEDREFKDILGLLIDQDSNNIPGCQKQLNFTPCRGSAFIASIADGSDNKTIILSVPEPVSRVSQLSHSFKGAFQLIPLQPLSYPFVPSSASSSEMKLCTKRKSCWAKKLASSRRERVGGKFKRCATKWVPATDFFQEAGGQGQA